MNRLRTLESLRLLASHHAPPCVSIYMPTHRRHTGAAEDSIRYRNQVNRVGKLLATSGGAGEARSRVAALEAIATEEFWTRPQEGLALFADGNGPQGVSEFRLGSSVPELAVVADSFHLRPLFRELQRAGRYYLLRLSQGEVELLAGDEHGLSRVALPGLPRTIEAALGEPVKETFLNVRSIPGAGGGAVFHGHGAGKEPPPEDMLRFFRSVDEALWSELREQKEPLVLAAPKPYHTPFRSVSRYPHLLREGLQGNYDRSRPDELQQMAWPLVQARIEARISTVLEAYGSRVSARRATDELAEVARCAVQGRVHDLLIADGTHLWGRLDRATGELELHERQVEAHDDDVLDDLAEAVILRGGDVFALGPERMPSRSPVAAILRW